MSTTAVSCTFDLPIDPPLESVLDQAEWTAVGVASLWAALVQRDLAEAEAAGLGNGSAAGHNGSRSAPPAATTGARPHFPAGQDWPWSSFCDDSNVVAECEAYSRVLQVRVAREPLAPFTVEAWGADQFRAIVETMNGTARL